MKKIIGIQGIKGSFHHIVSKQYFDSEDYIEEYLSFDELVNSLVDGRCNYAVMALENSIVLILSKDKILSLSFYGIKLTLIILYGVNHFPTIKE